MEHQGGTDDEPTKRVEPSTRGTSSGQDTVQGDGKPTDEIISTGLPITHGSPRSRRYNKKMDDDDENNKKNLRWTQMDDDHDKVML